ncbi:MAG: hypothetical protein CMG71_00055 [Candidatus Marinimicrobia bacterium]|nr:hypothetical protein [Candidatus Neomarinimicrobiota bacterium]|tara:strand:- start:2234 stop:5059 length:2826 start_codon:yes stop_codon:yes gene_type:complete
MRVLKSVVAVLCIFTFVFAGETGKIAGRVTDGSSGDALVGTNVIIEGTSYGAATDVNGEYFVINLPPGVYNVTFSMIGYAEYTATGVGVNVDVTTPLDVALQSEAVAGESVTVTAERPVIENTLTSSKQIVSGTLATELPVATMEDLVKTLPGVTTFDGKLHLRGGRSGEEMYLVDGASVMNPVMGGNAVPVNPAMIEELQVITGAFNAEYGQAMSGIFNTILKEAPDGVHANVSFRTSANQDYMKSEGGKDGAFKDQEFYGESLEISDGENYKNASTGSDYSEAAFGDPFSILDADVTVGMGAFGLVASMRSYNDPGRLPGISKEYGSYQGKMTYQVGGNLKLGAQFLFHDEKGMYDPRYDGQRVGEAAGELLVTDWKYAMEQYPRTEKQTLQFGLNANYVLSANTNITLHVDNLSTTQEDGAKTKDGKFIDFDKVKTVTYSGTSYNGADGPNHTKVLEDRAQNNAWFGMMNVYGHYFKNEENATTFSVDGTSQLNARHLIKGGVEYRSFKVDRLGHDVWFGRTVGYTDENPRLQLNNVQDVSPMEMMAYVQDQMEFSDMIVNVGLRYDAFNAGADRGVWDVNKNGDPMWVDDSINPFDPNQRRATETKAKLSPRLGVSFPVGNDMAFRYAYGTFFQRPAFYHLLDNYLAQMDGGTESGYFVFIGNPNLDPMQTTIYEMGVQYSLPGGLKLDVAGYNKDIVNLMAVNAATNNPAVDTGSGYDNPGGWTADDAYQATHFIFKSSDHFGRIRGVEFSLTKAAATGLSGRASYTYSVAEGTASDNIQSGAGSVDQFMKERSGTLTMTTLDWHRPHILNGYVDYQMPMGGILEGVGASLIFNAQSGLPMTARAGGAGAALKERAPATVDVNLKLDAQLALGGISPTVFLLIENVINRRNVVWVADPMSFFDETSNFNNVAAGPRNNLLAYGRPLTINFGATISF